jgi:hypothetical protein
MAAIGTHVLDDLISVFKQKLNTHKKILLFFMQYIVNNAYCNAERD